MYAKIYIIYSKPIFSKKNFFFKIYIYICLDTPIAGVWPAVTTAAVYCPDPPPLSIYQPVYLSRYLSIQAAATYYPSCRESQTQCRLTIEVTQIVALFNTITGDVWRCLKSAGGGVNLFFSNICIINIKMDKIGLQSLPLIIQKKSFCQILPNFAKFCTVLKAWKYCQLKLRKMIEILWNRLLLILPKLCKILWKVWQKRFTKFRGFQNFWCKP